MKKKRIYIFHTGIIILFLTLFNTLELRAQNSSSTIGLAGGYAQDGYAITLNYNYYVNRRDYVQAAIYASFSRQTEKEIVIPYDIFTTNIGYFRQIYVSNRETFNINIGLGGLVGYEVINNGKNRLETGALITSKSTFIYGGFASLELEMPISNHWSFIAKYNQFYHINSDLGEFTLFAGGGFRYFLFY